MRRVVVYPDRIAVEAADIPAPGPNEALVRTLVASVCGSDLHAARGSHPFVPLAYRPGHHVFAMTAASGRAAGARAAGPPLLVEAALTRWSTKLFTICRDILSESVRFIGPGRVRS